MGIAEDPQKRLFNDHNVQKNGFWIYVPTISDTIARFVEKYFLSKGCDGGDGGGGKNTKYVYAYKITDYTRQ